MNLQSPEDIYINVSNEVDSILSNLKDFSSDIQVSRAKENATEIFAKLSDELKSNIAALQRNAEWDTFTIAFYGETNAGKSTIIETMRILLKEPSKLAEQQEFRELQEKYGVSAERFAELRVAVAQAERNCAIAQTSLEEFDDRNDTRAQILRIELAQLRHFIDKQKQNASLWQKLTNFFIKLPEEKQNEALQLDLLEWEAEGGRTVDALKQQKFDAQQEHASQQQALKEAESAMAHLVSRADGAIIGNGQHDFTLEAKAYHFSNGNQKFALLDVPGIEGKESRVMDAIWAGVQKAHAVFYVTGKAAAPQKGDERHLGTLEKIEQHLGAQTEVWTIYNKRITNPMQLGQAELISEDEKASLRDLDKKMVGVLADKYRRTISLSAYPAFLASAQCLLPDSSTASNKAKFMAKLSQQDLLEKSGIAQFHQLLVTDLVEDHKAKIAQSNFNKANKVVRTAAAQVAAALSTTFKPLGKELEKDAEQAQLRLDIALDALKTRLEARGENAVNQFTNAVRKKIYARIDNDIGNDDFKDAFERIIRQEQAQLVAELPELMQAEVEKFQQQISEIIERFRTFAAELLDAYSSIRVTGLGGKFDLKIDIDNGINLPGLLGTLVGGALMIWNPAGWVVLAIGAFTVLVGAVKAVMGFFSSDYKKSQQRKATDANLDNIIAKMRKSLRESLDTALPQLEPKIDAMKKALDEPAAQVAGITALLAKSERQLKKISQTIETAGAL